MTTAVSEERISGVHEQLVGCLVPDHHEMDPEALKKALDARLAEVRHDVATKPVVYVGAGTCGLGAGAARTKRAIQSYCRRNGIDAEVLEVGCIGLCAVEPLVDIQLPGKTRLALSNVHDEEVPGLMKQVMAGQVPGERVLWQHNVEGLEGWPGVPKLEEHPFFKRQTRWVLPNCGIMDPASFEEYVARGGYTAFADAIRQHTPAELCDMVESSGLRGRGGGGFPTGKKWKFAQGQEADQKYLVCNADEGDPGAFMDRAVIEGDPHRLIEGMGIAAYAIGASKGYIYIRAEYPLAIERLKVAMQQARDNGLLGKNIHDSGFDFDIIIKMGAGAFVCGEETALLHSIEGKRGMPRPRPPFPAVKGLFGKPTIINNVETLSNLPTLMQMGPEAFASHGTETSKGTKVFALSGKIRWTGLVEVVMGTSIREVVMDIGGGCPHNKKFKAVQIGGPSGGCIPDSHLDIEIDYESLKTVGAMMGSGGLVVMDEDTCMVDVAKFFMDFIQRESCGKCIPCREGTLRMLEILNRITQGRRNESGNEALERFQGVMYMERLSEVIKDTSLCGLGQTSANPVLSTLRWFRDEYEAHIFERRCPAGVCTELRTFTIDDDACTGCGACAPKCPTHAIIGAPQKVHYVIEDKCIGCGACFDVCNYGAVKLRELEPVAVSAAEKAAAQQVEGLFSAGAFGSWHGGKRLLRLDEEGE